MRYEPGDRVQYVHPTRKHSLSKDGTVPVYGTVDKRNILRQDGPWVGVTWDGRHPMRPHEQAMSGERPEHLRLIQPGDDGYDRPTSKAERIREVCEAAENQDRHRTVAGRILSILDEEEGDL